MTEGNDAFRRALDAVGSSVADLRALRQQAKKTSKLRTDDPKATFSRRKDVSFQVPLTAARTINVGPDKVEVLTRTPSHAEKGPLTASMLGSASTRFASSLSLGHSTSRAPVDPPSNGRLLFNSSVLAASLPREEVPLRRVMNAALSIAPDPDQEEGELPQPPPQRLVPAADETNSVNALHQQVRLLFDMVSDVRQHARRRDEAAADAAALAEMGRFCGDLQTDIRMTKGQLSAVIQDVKDAHDRQIAALQRAVDSLASNATGSLRPRDEPAPAPNAPTPRTETSATDNTRAAREAADALRGMEDLRRDHEKLRQRVRDLEDVMSRRPSPSEDIEAATAARQASMDVERMQSELKELRMTVTKSEEARVKMEEEIKSRPGSPLVAQAPATAPAPATATATSRRNTSPGRRASAAAAAAAARDANILEELRNELRTGLGDVHADIDSIRSDVQQLEDDVAALKKANSGSAPAASPAATNASVAEISQLRTAVADVQSDVADAKRDVDQMHDDIKHVRGVLATMSGEIKKLRDDSTVRSVPPSPARPGVVAGGDANVADVRAALERDLATLRREFGEAEERWSHYQRAETERSKMVVARIDSAETSAQEAADRAQHVERDLARFETRVERLDKEATKAHAAAEEAQRELARCGRRVDVVEAETRRVATEMASHHRQQTTRSLGSSGDVGDAEEIERQIAAVDARIDEISNIVRQTAEDTEEMRADQERFRDEIAAFAVTADEVKLTREQLTRLRSDFERERSGGSTPVGRHSTGGATFDEKKNVSSGTLADLEDARAEHAASLRDLRRSVDSNGESVERLKDELRTVREESRALASAVEMLRSGRTGIRASVDSLDSGAATLGFQDEFRSGLRDLDERLSEEIEELRKHFDEKDVLMRAGGSAGREMTEQLEVSMDRLRRDVGVLRSEVEQSRVVGDELAALKEFEESARATLAAVTTTLAQQDSTPRKTSEDSRSGEGGAEKEAVIEDLRKMYREVNGWMADTQDDVDAVREDCSNLKRTLAQHINALQAQISDLCAFVTNPQDGPQSARGSARGGVSNEEDEGERWDDTMPEAYQRGDAREGAARRGENTSGIPRGGVSYDSDGESEADKPGVGRSIGSRHASRDSDFLGVDDSFGSRGGRSAHDSDFT